MFVEELFLDDISFWTALRQPSQYLFSFSRVWQILSEWYGETKRRCLFYRSYTSSCALVARCHNLQNRNMSVWYLLSWFHNLNGQTLLLWAIMILKTGCPQILDRWPIIGPRDGKRNWSGFFWSFLICTRLCWSGWPIHGKKDFCGGDGYFGQKKLAEKVRKLRQNLA